MSTTRLRRAFVDQVLQRLRPSGPTRVIPQSAERAIKGGSVAALLSGCGGRICACDTQDCGGKIEMFGGPANLMAYSELICALGKVAEEHGIL